MIYLKLYEDFEFWEEISVDDWYGSNLENQPFSETEYDTLVNFCNDNDKYIERTIKVIQQNILH